MLYLEKGIIMFVSELGFVLFYVKSPIASAAFYSRILGVEPVVKTPSLVIFSLNHGVMFALSSRYTAEPNVESQPGSSEICFFYENIDALFESWAMQGIIIAKEPTNRQCGAHNMDMVRNFVALDPDGHRIRVYRIEKSKSKNAD